jgi:hypothetical protein
VLDNELYRRTVDGMLLKCLSEEQARVTMGEVHEEMCDTHQSTHKMKWMLKRVEFYWPTMMEDCFKYFKGFEACQRFRDMQLVPVSMMRPVVKPWSFQGLNFIGEIHPWSSKGHQFILVATDYFTK